MVKKYLQAGNSGFLSCFSIDSDDLSIVVLLTLQLYSIRQLWRTHTGSERDGSCLHAYLVPQSTVEECLQSLGATFYNQTLLALGIEIFEDTVDVVESTEALGNTLPMMRQHETFGIVAGPQTYVEPGMITI